MNTLLSHSQAQLFKINQFSVPVTNQPGELTRLLLTLKSTNILAISADAGSSAQILVKFVTDLEPTRVKMLLKTQNFGAFVTPVFALKIGHSSGQLLRVTEWLAENGINIRTVYGTAGPNESHSWIVFETEDASEAEKILFEKYFFQ